MRTSTALSPAGGYSGLGAGAAAAAGLAGCGARFPLLDGRLAPGRGRREAVALRQQQGPGEAHRRRLHVVHRQTAAAPAGRPRAAGARPDAAAVRRLLLGRSGRGRQRTLPSASWTSPRSTARTMTFFLSGLYLLPESKKRLYNPPRNPRAPPTSATSPTPTPRTPSSNCPPRLAGRATEIGTRFNGHFCAAVGSRGPLDAYAVAQRDRPGRNRLREGVARPARRLHRPARLPFMTTDKELVGGRTPCLLEPGRTLLPTARPPGLALRRLSARAACQVWPVQEARDLEPACCRQVPFPGRSLRGSSRWTTTSSPTSR